MDPSPQNQSTQPVPPPADPLQGAAFGHRIIIPEHVRDLKNAIRQLCVDTGANAMQFLYKERLIGKVGPNTDTKSTANLITNTASCTKSVVAIAMFILKEQRSLDLDRPICELLTNPGWEFLNFGDYKKITSRHLLTHTSGLAGNAHFFPNASSGNAHFFPKNKSPRVPGDRQFFNHLAPSYDRNRRAAMHPLQYAVGSRPDYSNPGTQLLAAVAAQALHNFKPGCTVSEFITQEIFVPLGMTNSSLTEENGVTIFNGGMMSTAEDLAKLGLFICNLGKVGSKQILTEDSILEMLSTPDKIIPKAAVNYGHLWRKSLVGAFSAIGDLANGVWILPEDGIIISRTQPVPPLPAQPVDERSSKFIPLPLREAFDRERRFFRGLEDSLGRYRSEVPRSGNHFLSGLFEEMERQMSLGGVLL